MKTPNQWLNQVMSRHSLPSDYALAAHLGITRSAVSRYRNDPGATFDDAVCARIAASLDLDPAHLMACMATMRAKDPALRATWERIAKQFPARAAAVALFVFAWLFGGPGDQSGAKVEAGLNIIFIGALARPRKFAKSLPAIHIVRHLTHSTKPTQRIAQLTLRLALNTAQVLLRGLGL